MEIRGVLNPGRVVSSGPYRNTGRPLEIVKVQHRFHSLKYCWWPVEVGSSSHSWQRFSHPQWCKISSINRNGWFSTVNPGVGVTRSIIHNYDICQALRLIPRKINGGFTWEYGKRKIIWTKPSVRGSKLIFGNPKNGGWVQIFFSFQLGDF